MARRERYAKDRGIDLGGPVRPMIVHRDRALSELMRR